VALHACKFDLVFLIFIEVILFTGFEKPRFPFYNFQVRSGWFRYIAPTTARSLHSSSTAKYSNAKETKVMGDVQEAESKV